MSREFADLINAATRGLVHHLGLHVVDASRDRVTATLEIDDRHLQGYGIVHGGVYCAIVETLASIGAAVDQLDADRAVAGLENHTSFIRAIRSGRLTAVAEPIARGRRSQVWEATVRDQDDRLVATGRVRLHVFEPEQEIAGEKPIRG